MFDQCSRKIYKFTVFFTPEEMNDLSILGGGGGGEGGHGIIFDTSDGAMRFFGGNTVGHEKKQGFWRKVSGPGSPVHYESSLIYSQLQV